MTAQTGPVILERHVARKSPCLRHHKRMAACDECMGRHQ